MHARSCNARSTRPPRSKAPAVRGLAFTLISLNTADAVISLWTTKGGLDEYSPLWDQMLRSSPVAFLALKVGGGAALSLLLLWVAQRRVKHYPGPTKDAVRSISQVLSRTRRLARSGLMLCTVVYSILLGYHCWVLGGGTKLDLYQYRIVNSQ